jgi:hypothetical protein
MRKAEKTRQARVLVSVTLLAAGVMAMTGCESKWNSTPGPYTSGDQAVSYTRVPSDGRAESDGVGPATRRSYDGAAIAPTAPMPDSPAVVAPASGDTRPASNPALVPAVPQTRPAGVTPRLAAPAGAGSPRLPATRETARLSPATPAAPSARPATLPAGANVETRVVTGTLEGGQAGIGGETTGWRLRTDDAPPKSIEVDVAAVREQARKLDGKRVRVVGVYITRAYVERGNVTILSARRIEPAPPGGANK